MVLVGRIPATPPCRLRRLSVWGSVAVAVCAWCALQLPRQTRPVGSAELAAVRVSSMFGVDCLSRARPGCRSARRRGWQKKLAVAADWAHNCGIHRVLTTLPYKEAIDHFYAASVARMHVEVEVVQADMRCNLGPPLRGKRVLPLSRGGHSSAG